MITQQFCPAVHVQALLPEAVPHAEAVRQIARADRGAVLVPPSVDRAVNGRSGGSTGERGYGSNGHWAQWHLGVRGEAVPGALDVFLPQAGGGLRM